jgi:hypothetical protein
MTSLLGEHEIDMRQIHQLTMRTPVPPVSHPSLVQHTVERFIDRRMMQWYVTCGRTNPAGREV